MIHFEKHICHIPCNACGHREPGTRYLFKIGPVLDTAKEIALCIPCKNQFYFPLKYGWQKGMSCRVIAPAYDKGEQFKIVAFYEEMKAVRVKNEEGEEHTVLLSQLEAW